MALEQKGFNVHVVPEDPKYFLFPFEPDYTKRDPLTETPGLCRCMCALFLNILRLVIWLVAMCIGFRNVFVGY